MILGLPNFSVVILHFITKRPLATVIKVVDGFDDLLNQFPISTGYLSLGDGFQLVKNIFAKLLICHVVLYNFLRQLVGRNVRFDSPRH